MMPSYSVYFYGCTAGAIGKKHLTLHDTVILDESDISTDTKNDIRLALYRGDTASGKSYDHILNIAYLTIK